MAVQLLHQTFDIFDVWPSDLNMDATSLNMCSDSYCVLTRKNARCSPISRITSGYQRWQWTTHRCFQPKPWFSSRISQPCDWLPQDILTSGGRCHRVSYISSFNMTGLGGAHSTTTMIQHAWASSPTDKNTTVRTTKMEWPTMIAASKNNFGEETHSAGRSRWWSYQLWLLGSWTLGNSYRHWLVVA